MKLASILFFAVLAGTACNSSGSRQSTGTDSTAANATQQYAPAVNSLCFLQLGGLKKQDSSYVQLFIDGNNISGTFNSVPYEKDSRKGTLHGTKQHDVIKAVWRFMQEGMNDSIAVEFKLSGNKLLQKSLSVDPATGRQFTSDTARFDQEFNKIDCASLPAAQ